MQLTMEAKSLKLEYDCDTDTTVTADAARMAQVVENFASNAVRYTPPEGQIQVQIRTGKGGTTFTIENTGDPLPYEALSKVWDTFYRTDESRTGTGTGLGLAIARQIVELHGGKCSVWNTRTGVAFRFALP